jgi:hypothetical protein
MIKDTVGDTIYTLSLSVNYVSDTLR